MREVLALTMFEPLRLGQAGAMCAVPSWGAGWDFSGYLHLDPSGSTLCSSLPPAPPQLHVLSQNKDPGRLGGWREGNCCLSDG